LAARDEGRKRRGLKKRVEAGNAEEGGMLHSRLMTGWFKKHRDGKRGFGGPEKRTNGKRRRME